jgi:hypothetical protein
MLFFSDGTNREVYIVDLGGNGVVGGGDDRAAGHFDVGDLGLKDPEGIDYNPNTQTIFVVSTRGPDQFVLETTISGAVVAIHDLSFLGAVRRSGLAFAPSSQDPGALHLYIASRGVDNDEDKNENDGKVYEIALGSSPPPPPGHILTFFPAFFR